MLLSLFPVLLSLGQTLSSSPLLVSPPFPFDSFCLSPLCFLINKMRRRSRGCRKGGETFQRHGKEISVRGTHVMHICPLRWSVCFIQRPCLICKLEIPRFPRSWLNICLLFNVAFVSFLSKLFPACLSHQSILILNICDTYSLWIFRF